MTVTDIVPPDLSSPEDVTYEFGTSGRAISWTGTDADPLRYEVYHYAGLYTEGFWNRSGEFITINTDRLEVGAYAFVMDVWDEAAYEAADSVDVTVVDTTPPQISEPDFSISHGTTGYAITWSVVDPHLHFCNITRNGTLVYSGQLSSSEFVLSVDGLGPGVYNFTLRAFDEY